MKNPQENNVRNATMLSLHIERAVETLESVQKRCSELLEKGQINLAVLDNLTNYKSLLILMRDMANLSSGYNTHTLTTDRKKTEFIQNLFISLLVDKSQMPSIKDDAREFLRIAAMPHKYFADTIDSIAKEINYLGTETNKVGQEYTHIPMWEDVLVPHTQRTEIKQDETPVEPIQDVGEDDSDPYDPTTGNGETIYEVGEED
jgi:hypothetical protein